MSAQDVASKLIADGTAMQVIDAVLDFYGLTMVRSDTKQFEVEVVGANAPCSVCGQAITPGNLVTYRRTHNWECTA